MLLQFLERKYFSSNQIFFQDIIQKIRSCDSQDEALFCAYTEISKKYHGDRIKTLTHFYKLFIFNIKILEHTSGFLHCTNLNFILKYVLIKSGKFSQKEIEYKWTFIWGFSPHQYLKVGDKNIDIWAKKYGITFGDYTRYFH